MYSPEITQAPVTLFLGAGASKPFDKMLMAEFINSLAFDKRFNSSPLYSQIIQEKPDLEFLFEQLEQWQEKGYAERPFGRPTLGYVQPTGIVNHARELLIALREKVFEAYRDIDAPNRIKIVRIFNELLDGIFNDLEQSQYPLVVFTTNYDPAVEAYCDESKSYVLEDGFQQERGAFVWRRESFDGYKTRASKKHVVLFKLHGSARWVKKDGRILKMPFPIYAHQDGEFENVVIYPATRKVALDDPFYTAYDYFQRTMDACGCCIVVGYSFRDYDALTKLASASIFNPRLKLLVVDPDSENLCKRLSQRGIRCTPAPQKFGEDIAYMHEVGVHIAEALRNAKSKSTTAP